jgi:uncharacterized protein involved in cysteine biosynthesis
VFTVIIFIQAADYDSPAGTGMDELIIFQINTYMTGNPFFSAVMEEYQISFAQVSTDSRASYAICAAFGF